MIFPWPLYFYIEYMIDGDPLNQDYDLSWKFHWLWWNVFEQKKEPIEKPCMYFSTGFEQIFRTCILWKYFQENLLIFTVDEPDKLI